MFGWIFGATIIGGFFAESVISYNKEQKFRNELDLYLMGFVRELRITKTKKRLGEGPRRYNNKVPYMDDRLRFAKHRDTDGRSAEYYPREALKKFFKKLQYVQPYCDTRSKSIVNTILAREPVFLDNFASEEKYAELEMLCDQLITKDMPSAS